jgi:uncharacterized membrane protein
MGNDAVELAKKFFHSELEELSEVEKKVIAQIIARKEISRNTNKEFDTTLTLGEKWADKVASFGGSWTFIILFSSILLVWIVLNSFLLVARNDVFDPYPYILLNLVLSMVAAMQAPVILMSQNRAAAKDRMEAQQDYEVNLKTELEIISLHEKFDQLREKQWSDLLTLQQEQINMLSHLLNNKKAEEEKKS